MIISLGVELLQRSSNLPIPQTQIVWISGNNLNLSRADFLYPKDIGGTYLVLHLVEVT